MPLGKISYICSFDINFNITIYANQQNFLGGVVLTILLSACSPKVVYHQNSTPEESGLSLMKITDESVNIVAGARSSTLYGSISGVTAAGLCANAGFTWSANRFLDISPDGSELAYLSFQDNVWNIMVRRSGPQGAATQRTFRQVLDFSWGIDNKLYFGDATQENRIQISSTDAHVGSLMRQHTNNNFDMHPVLSKDGKRLYFTRVDKSGAFVWSYDLETGALTACCRGYNPCPIGDGSSEFICVRNSSHGTSELWHINYEKAQETLILADKNRGFTNPQVSPDGQWILCQGNSKSSISKKNNLDIFVVKFDGTSFLQLTYHPADDCCPVWSEDGKFIYFISSRATSNDSFNIWKMRFDL